MLFRQNRQHKPRHEEAFPDAGAEHAAGFGDGMADDLQAQTVGGEVLLGRVQAGVRAQRIQVGAVLSAVLC